jgi:glycosyltransferase involved in cell wall biosynthesis
VKIGVVLSGLHRIDRGAEVALEAIASGLSRLGNDVVVVGGGPPDTDRPYRYRQGRLIDRGRFERFPRFPPLRSETAYEELTFALGLLGRTGTDGADVTITCSYPFTNWLLTRTPIRRRRPAHVFVTQNGDYPAASDGSEFRYFRCDGLVCTNPEYEARNRNRWKTALIGNGVDTERFAPRPSQRADLGLPASAPIVLIVSALIESKHVQEGIRAVADVDDAFLVIAGDGPLRTEVDGLCAELLRGRHRRTTVPAAEMPALYHAADVLLHMSRTESFGNIYVEALCSGLPVVAHDSSVTRWILGADHPGLVDTTARTSVVDAVTNALDAGRSAAGPLVSPAATRFSWSTISRQYQEFLLDVVASSAESSGGSKARR